MVSNNKQRPALSIHRMRMSKESEAEVARRADVYLMNALKEIKEEAELSKQIKPFMGAMKIEPSSGVNNGDDDVIYCGMTLRSGRMLKRPSNRGQSPGVKFAKVKKEEPK